MSTVPGWFPRGAKIMLLGQSPGVEERDTPFVGAAGRQLNEWLRIVGLKRSEVAITNVWNEHLPNFQLSSILTSTPGRYQFGPKAWIKEAWEWHFDRLQEEIDEHQPNIIVALGAEALWALTGSRGITSYRGSLFYSRQGPKAIATFHPSFIIRGQWDKRSLCIVDLYKAKRESQSPDLVTTERYLWLDPSLDDLKTFKRDYIDDATMLFVDIETDPAAGHITHVGFAPSADVAICCPFMVGKSAYWPSLEHEQEAVRWVRSVCENEIPKCLQNGLYDAYWFWEYWRIKLVNYVHDTRLLSHAVFPGLPKTLGFIGSVWANEQAWKLLGRATKKDD